MLNGVYMLDEQQWRLQHSAACMRQFYLLTVGRLPPPPHVVTRTSPSHVCITQQHDPLYR